MHTLEDYTELLMSDKIVAKIPTNIIEFCIKTFVTSQLWAKHM